MKNIQVIEGAANCVYDIFSVTDEEFALIFPAGTDVAFIDDVYERGDAHRIEARHVDPSLCRASTLALVPAELVGVAQPGRV